MQVVMQNSCITDTLMTRLWAVALIIKESFYSLKRAAVSLHFQLSSAVIICTAASPKYFLILKAPCTTDGILSLSKKSYSGDRKVQIHSCFCLAQKDCGDVILWYLRQCVCMEMEVTMNQGEEHCSNHIFSEVADPRYIMSCPHHEIHQRNSILDCLVYNTEHPAPHRLNYKAKYAPWHFAVRPNWNSVFKINSSDLIPPKPCCELPSS